MKINKRKLEELIKEQVEEVRVVQSQFIEDLNKLKNGGSFGPVDAGSGASLKRFMNLRKIEPNMAGLMDDFGLGLVKNLVNIYFADANSDVKATARKSNCNLRDSSTLRGPTRCKAILDNHKAVWALHGELSTKYFENPDYTKKSAYMTGQTNESLINVQAIIKEEIDKLLLEEPSRDPDADGNYSMGIGRGVEATSLQTPSVKKAILLLDKAISGIQVPGQYHKHGFKETPEEELADALINFGAALQGAGIERRDALEIVRLIGKLTN